MRERLDIVSPQQLRRPFKKIFSYSQRGKALESYRYLGGHCIISLDGTGQFSFLIDQVQQLCCKVYQQARKHVGTLLGSGYIIA